MAVVGGSISGGLAELVPSSGLLSNESVWGGVGRVWGVGEVGHWVRADGDVEGSVVPGSFGAVGDLGGPGVLDPSNTLDAAEQPLGPLPGGVGSGVAQPESPGCRTEEESDYLGEQVRVGWEEMVGDCGRELDKVRGGRRDELGHQVDVRKGGSGDGGNIIAGNCDSRHDVGILGFGVGQRALIRVNCRSCGRCVCGSGCGCSCCSESFGRLYCRLFYPRLSAGCCGGKRADGRQAAAGTAVVANWVG